MVAQRSAFITSDSLLSLVLHLWKGDCRIWMVSCTNTWSRIYCIFRASTKLEDKRPSGNLNMSGKIGKLPAIWKNYECDLLWYSVLWANALFPWTFSANGWNISLKSGQNWSGKNDNRNNRCQPDFALCFCRKLFCLCSGFWCLCCGRQQILLKWSVKKSGVSNSATW